MNYNYPKSWNDRRIGDRILYTWDQTGKRQQLCGPLGRRENANFLIVWQGKDWSGFLTYDELLARMTELEERGDITNRLHLFDAVERI